MPPVGFAIATLTIMLWIIWSDSLRAKRPTPLVYTARTALYLIASGILILNMIRYPEQFNTTARGFSVAAAVVGIGGAAYFARRLVRRT